MKRARVNIIILSHPNSGYSMVKTSKMIKQCIEKFTGNNIFLIPYGTLSSKNFKNKYKKYLRYLELYIIFPFQIIHCRVLYSIERILIVDHSDAIHLFYFKKNKATTIVHDQFAYLAAQSKIPGVRVRISGRIYQALINKGLGRSRRLLSVSEYTRRNLIELKFTQEIHVLNLTWNPWLPVELNQELKRELPDNYAILVSPYSWRKNRPFAINCILELRKFSQLNSLQLIIVGDALSNLELSEINSTNLDFITFMAAISDQELKSLYEKSKFCIVASRYEGYGLPILEANSLGVPCLHNKLPSFMEITNDQNVILNEKLEYNDWCSIAIRVSNFVRSQQLAANTEHNFGFEIFKNRLNIEYFL
jgi:hypothetical protein